MNAIAREQLAFILEARSSGAVDLLTAAKVATDRILSLEKLFRELDDECFAGEVLQSFPEGTRVGLGEFKRRLVARIKKGTR